ncbi:MAG: hypothetical protein D6705_12990 [Deltaproteobacteria bacterium]|nr:MAG: hypothetical protein D6705_12990 [Deltaproteobacteria bacterium]
MRPGARYVWIVATGLVACGPTARPARPPHVQGEADAGAVGNAASDPSGRAAGVPSPPVRAITFELHHCKGKGPAPAVVEAAAAGDADALAAALAAGAEVDTPVACGLVDVEERTPAGGEVGRTVALEGEPPLVVAALRGDGAVVGALLAAGADPNGRTGGRRPLIDAACLGHASVVDRLLEVGADPAPPVRRDAVARGSVIACLAEAGDARRAARLIEAGATVGPEEVVAAAAGGIGLVIDAAVAAGTEPCAPDRRGRRPLVEAARAGHRAVVERLLRSGCGITTEDGRGVRPLVAAAREGRDDVCRMLVDAGAPVGREDVLAAAAEGGLVWLVDAALRAGAPPDAGTASGTPALLAAARRGHGDVVARLRRAGAEVAAQELLVAAAAGGLVDEVRRLIEAGTRPDASGCTGRTALAEAAAAGHGDVVDALLVHDADPNRVTGEGFAPLHLAAMGGHASVAARLIEAGARLDEPCEPEGRTALAWAAAEGHLAVVDLLLGRGADPNAADREGHTPLHLAAEAGAASVVRRLLAAGADPTLRDGGGATPCERAVRREVAEILAGRCTP